MTGPFEEDEFMEDEWVDVYDMEGRKASLRHLATVRCHGNAYMILGAIHEDADEHGGLLLVREDLTADGEKEFVVVNNRQEAEAVIGYFVMSLMEMHMDDLPEEIAQEFERMEAEAMEEAQDAVHPCGCFHKPGEFCFCSEPEYLQ